MPILGAALSQRSRLMYFMMLGSNHMPVACLTVYMESTSWFCQTLKLPKQIPFCQCLTLLLPTYSCRSLAGLLSCKRTWWVTCYELLKLCLFQSLGQLGSPTQNLARQVLVTSELEVKLKSSSDSWRIVFPGCWVTLLLLVWACSLHQVWAPNDSESSSIDHPKHGSSQYAVWCIKHHMVNRARWRMILTALLVLLVWRTSRLNVHSSSAQHLDAVLRCWSEILVDLSAMNHES